MGIFRKLHNRTEPPGLETRLLRSLPAAALASIVLPALIAFGARIYGSFVHFENASKTIKSVDIFAVSIAATLLTAVFTVAIGCVVVRVMKGPAYVADSYPVSHANRPADENKRQD